MFNPDYLKLIHKSLSCYFAKLAWFSVTCLLLASIGFTGCKGSKRGRSRHTGSTVNRTIDSKQISKIVSTARSYAGTPHRDGGVNRLGIDCSALMVVSFESIGFKLPRTSKEQANLGKSIHLREVKPGDLVFFADRAIGSGITHVGLVTEVNGPDKIKFIHTSSKLGVVENLLSHSYFKKTFVKAMRPYS